MRVRADDERGEQRTHLRLAADLLLAREALVGVVALVALDAVRLLVAQHVPEAHQRLLARLARRRRLLSAHLLLRCHSGARFYCRYEQIGTVQKNRYRICYRI